MNNKSKTLEAFSAYGLDKAFREWMQENPTAVVISTTMNTFERSNSTILYTVFIIYQLLEPIGPSETKGV